MRTPRPLARRIATAAGTTAVLLVPLTGTAWAHVDVSATNPVQGGYTKLVFRVPTERDVATTKVELVMPTDTLIASVGVQPVAGWDYTETVEAPPEAMTDDDGASIAEVVTRVAFTATGDGIGPGEFQEFALTAGPLPETDRAVFKVLQTYADGEVASWIEEQQPGAAEPEAPAPVLELRPADADAEATGAAATADPAAAVTAVPVSASDAAAGSSSGSGAATTLAGLALGVGVLALLGSGYAVLRSRRPGA